MILKNIEVFWLSDRVSSTTFLDFPDTYFLLIFEFSRREYFSECWGFALSNTGPVGPAIFNKIIDCMVSSVNIFTFGHDDTISYRHICTSIAGQTSLLSIDSCATFDGGDFWWWIEIPNSSANVPSWNTCTIYELRFHVHVSRVITNDVDHHSCALHRKIL